MPDLLLYTGIHGYPGQYYSNKIWHENENGNDYYCKDESLNAIQHSKLIIIEEHSRDYISAKIRA